MCVFIWNHGHLHKGFSAFDDVLYLPFIVQLSEFFGEEMQFWRTRKPSGLINNNSLEMGKYYEAKKMIDHERECH
ncbi:uncharacterized protein MONOS_16868 [Monocercomonoides exilis]|uniref:uncharacterized protein n=1 Tax=Monocercomonoides exilis TaxID=2049356 RepID=UPI0035598A4C|nr:hypothetical protein MONOS_16868 [Monocercomonoides exilis]